MQAREMRRVHDGRAADAVEVDDLDRRVVVIDRVVFRPSADIGARRIIAEEPRLPVAPRARILRGIHPAALIEAEDMHLGVGEAPGHGRAGGSGANDQDIDGFVHSCSFF